MKVGIVPVHTDLILKALGMPEDASIIDVRMAFDRTGLVEFKVSHEAMQDVPEGYHISHISPMSETVHAHTKFVGWQ